ncbi:hypothetical protein [Flavobacterium terrae]|uniref:Uncharacterized protein n=1 Tax=Flavobacterium terrae TaxID=415425 RepID=A0A1M6DLB2_9FLAO|nr:hypothetical protein [Flavobacterium terrae]SHI73849.1 hypothetical protein SAMN05444363_1508 [Flavobacterium terrae]
MKIMVSILSFIVVVLSVVPCYAYHGDSKHQIETQHEENSGKCDDDCDGNCSPFYSCGTCTGFISEVTVSFKIDRILIHEDTSMQPYSYKNPIYSAFFCSIWQPPKIV